MAKLTEESENRLDKVRSFIEWASSFKTISNEIITSYAFDLNKKFSLYEMKHIFAEKYQDRIEFSYVLGVEKGLTREVHIKKKKIWNECFFVHCIKNGSGIGDPSSYEDGGSFIGFIVDTEEDYLITYADDCYGKPHHIEVFSGFGSSLYGNSSEFGNGKGEPMEPPF